MESRLPAFAPRFSRTVGLTLEILQDPRLAEDLSAGLADLAGQFAPGVSERIYVRIPLGSGWLEGWFVPQVREFEPIAWIPPADAAEAA
jgi:hypothetical protein